MVETTPAVVTSIVVLTIGSIFLVLYLWKKYKEMKAIWDNQNKWPPMYNRCPDYWEDAGNNDKGTAVVCKNTKGLGNQSTAETAEFIDPNGKDAGTLTSLCQRAKQMGVTWEGIDSYCM
jgi:hypothetical protein